MFSRVVTLPVLLAALVLVACSGAPPTPTPLPASAMSTLIPTPVPTPTLSPTPTPASAMPTLIPTPVPTPTLPPTPMPELSYLAEEIPPCTPIQGSSVDPCEPGAAQPSSSGSGSLYIGSEPLSVRYLLEQSGGGALWTGHIVLRGTYIPDTVRCIGGRSRSSFGGFSDEVKNLWYPPLIAGSIKCYADVRVGAYVLGSGPPTLTVLVGYFPYFPARGSRPAEEVRVQIERALIEGGKAYWKRIPPGGITGREAVLFLGPSGDALIESWQVFMTWDVQRRGDGTVVAVHPHRHFWWQASATDCDADCLSSLQMELPAFKQAVAKAHQARVDEYGGRVLPGPSYPMLVTDANRLPQFLTSIGAYSHPEGPPAAPPAVYAAAPASLTATASGEEGADLSWGAVSGVSGYHVQRRFGGDEKWTTEEESVTGTSYAASGLWCGRTHEFRVGAYGDGARHNAKAGRWSPTATATTGTCTPQSPRFYAGSYSFEVASTIPAGDAVGAVSAYDVNDDPVTYSITAGNSANKFAIDRSTGEVTVAGSLGAQAGTTYTLTVGAADGVSGTTGVTVTVSVLAPTCSLGAAVSDAPADYWLVRDCEALLSIKDRLRGAGTLNWSAGTAITSWDGVTVGGTITAVTRLNLSNRGLTGRIPAELGNARSLEHLLLNDNRLTGNIPPEVGTLFALTHLDLSGNSLTGDIPRELGWPDNLEEVRLSGNSLTGCIPVGLKDVAVNDLSSLNLPLYCQPPAPRGLSAGAPGDTSVPLSWDAVANVSKYRVEYRLWPWDWTVDDDTITTTSHTVEGLTCESTYRFRVSAYGSGTVYAAAWSEWSAALTETTAECVSPVFDESSYAFEVPEHAGVGTAVGTVSATDPNEDTVAYSITAGNGAGKFAIGRSTGEITVAGSLDASTASSYTLTVQASDGSNTGTATVEITVLPPTISLTGVPETMVQWDLERFRLLLVYGVPTAR